MRNMPDGRHRVGTRVRVVGVAKELGIKNSMSVFNTDNENVFVNTLGTVFITPRKGAKTVCVTLDEFNSKLCQVVDMRIDRCTIC